MDDALVYGQTVAGVYVPILVDDTGAPVRSAPDLVTVEESEP